MNSTDPEKADAYLGRKNDVIAMPPERHGN